MSIKIDQKIVNVSVVNDDKEELIGLDDFDLEQYCEDCDHKAKAEDMAKVDSDDYGVDVKRPEVLPAAVYKLKDPTRNTNIYCSISNMGGKPFEIFINSRHTESQQWVSAMTVLISAMFRAGVPADFIGSELQQIVDSNPFFYKGKSGCTVSHIGRVILQHCKDSSDITALVEKTDNIKINSENKVQKHGSCPNCSGDMILMDGCPTCLDCGHSKCG
jgi:ribonucleoside-diphosphate reductase alpha chain